MTPASCFDILLWVVSTDVSVAVHALYPPHCHLMTEFIMVVPPPISLISLISLSLQVLFFLLLLLMLNYIFISP